MWFAHHLFFLTGAWLQAPLEHHELVTFGPKDTKIPTETDFQGTASLFTLYMSFDQSQ